MRHSVIIFFIARDSQACCLLKTIPTTSVSLEPPIQHLMSRTGSTNMWWPVGRTQSTRVTREPKRPHITSYEWVRERLPQSDCGSPMSQLVVRSRSARGLHKSLTRGG